MVRPRIEGSRCLNCGRNVNKAGTGVKMTYLGYAPPNLDSGWPTSVSYVASITEALFYLFQLELDPAEHTNLADLTLCSDCGQLVTRLFLLCKQFETWTAHDSFLGVQLQGMRKEAILERVDVDEGHNFEIQEQYQTQTLPIEQQKQRQQVFASNSISTTTSSTLTLPLDQDCQSALQLALDDLMSINCYLQDIPTATMASVMDDQHPEPEHESTAMEVNQNDQGVACSVAGCGTRASGPKRKGSLPSLLLQNRNLSSQRKSCQHCDTNTGDNSSRGSAIEGQQILVPCSTSYTHAKICVTCGKPFKSKDFLQIHKLSHFSKEERQRHIAQLDKSFLCSTCGATFAFNASLADHCRRHCDSPPKRPKKRYHCTKCFRSFSVRRTLLAHMQQHATQAIWPCKHCSQAFDLESELANHRFFCEGLVDQRPFPCTLCSKRFIDKLALRNHLLGVHRLPRAEVRAVVYPNAKLIPASIADSLYTSSYPFSTKWYNEQKMHEHEKDGLQEV